MSALGARQAYLDGELCGVFPDGITSFSMIQAASDAGSAARLVFFIFDLLHLDGEDRDPDMAARHGYDRRDFDLGHKLLLIDGEHDVFGDGSVVCLPTYGHKPGQSVVEAAPPQAAKSYSPAMPAISAGLSANAACRGSSTTARRC